MKFRELGTEIKIQSLIGIMIGFEDLLVGSVVVGPREIKLMGYRTDESIMGFDFEHEGKPYHVKFKQNGRSERDSLRFALAIAYQEILISNRTRDISQTSP